MKPNPLQELARVLVEKTTAALNGTEFSPAAAAVALKILQHHSIQFVPDSAVIADLGKTLKVAASVPDFDEDD